MTEKEAWLKIAETCIKAGENGQVPFLCCEVNDIVSPGLYFSMKQRLGLFNPGGNYGVWWNFPCSNQEETQTSLNNQRATACGLLAAMCDD